MTSTEFAAGLRRKQRAELGTEAKNNTYLPGYRANSRLQRISCFPQLQFQKRPKRNCPPDDVATVCFSFPESSGRRGCCRASSEQATDIVYATCHYIGDVAWNLATSVVADCQWHRDQRGDSSDKAFSRTAIRLRNLSTFSCQRTE